MPIRTAEHSVPALHAPGAVASWSDLAIRFLLAAFFITYGVAKLLGTQFIRSGPTLDLFIAEASGFELTWAYFGFSPLYSHAIALGQIVLAGMLLFGRTRRLGSLGLMAIISNIVLVNFGYNISTATQILSVVLLAMNTYLLWLDFPAIKRFFWDEPPAVGGTRPGMRTGITMLVGLSLVSLAFVSYTKARFMADGALSGDWWVEELTIDGEPAPTLPGLADAWEKVHFDQGGVFGIRTERGLLHGRFDTGQDSTVIVRFNPHSQRRDRRIARTDGPADRATEPIVVPFRYSLAADGGEIALFADHEGRQIRMLLRPWVWIRT